MSVARRYLALALVAVAFVWLSSMALEAEEAVPAASPATPLLFTATDLKDARSLALKLRAARDPLTRYIAERCCVRTKQLLGAYQGAQDPNPVLCQMMVRDLNRLMITESIYDPVLFSKVQLSDATRNLIEDRATADRLQLNRLLLEDAFSDELLRVSAQSLDVRADNLEMDSVKRMLVASGHVLIRKNPDNLRADHAVVNLDTMDVIADGNVTLEQGSAAWAGQKLRYNFKTGQGDFGGFTAYMDPFYIKSKSSYQEKNGEYVIENADLTPCEGKNPLAYMHARKVWISPGHHIRAKHVVLYLGGVPVMYAPYWSQNIGDPNFISVVPGYNRRMWAYLLTAFNYRISKKVEAASHIDLRLRRGVAVGQDIMWSASGNAKQLSTERYMNPTPDEPWAFMGKKNWENMSVPGEVSEEEDAWFGDAIAYYARDAWPDEGKAQDYTIGENRYRMRLYHSQNLGEHDYFLAQINYLSDPKFIEQYFREEYKSSPDPDNYFVFTHHTDHYTLSMEIEQRLNDFYTSLNRTPILTLDISRQQIMESPFYYQGKTDAGYFSQEWESNLTNEQNYAAFRFDTDHTIYYPKKFFGFLTTIPRVGYRGTWYSATKQDYTNLVVNPVLNTNGVPVISNGVPVTTVTTNILMERMGAQYRNLYQLGMENSMKAFKVWETYPGDIINNVRHIVEPYTDYTFVPEPNVLATNLYHFDGSDSLGMQNSLLFGIRNKIQTKRHTIYDLLYVDIWTAYRFQTEPTQNVLSNVAFDVRSSPFDWLILRVDGSYDTYAPTFQTFNTRLTVLDRTFWSYEVEHRYEESNSSLLFNTLTISPYVGWRFSGYCRYEFEDSTLEEYGLSVQRMFGCLTAKVGFDWLDEDYDVWLQFWFTEFPKVRVDAGL